MSNLNLYMVASYLMGLFIGVAACYSLLKRERIREKIEAYDRGHSTGYDLGFGEGLNQPDEDPYMDYREEGIGHLKE